MKISLAWLNEYIDVKAYFKKPHDLAQLLTHAGLEVENVEAQGAALDHVRVGQIEVLGKHPNADRLTLCQVNVGDGVLRQIVCGAKNHKQGDKVCVALPGAVLPGNFAIKLSKIRDVESQGMLCSDKELGFSQEAEGIKILPADAPVGKTVKEYLGLDDIIFEINVTPNRADCLSHIGLAREISALTGKKIKLPVIKNKKTNWSTKKLAKIELKAKSLCPRYAAKVIKNVKVDQSPLWLKRRLESLGVNSINNIVDVTNFVMFECGQPMHAFDLEQLSGQHVIIDKARAGEAFTTLAGSVLTLTDSDLTIRDAKNTIALAGIIGGKNSGVTESTKDILLESAHFFPAAVRRSSRRLGVDTDSSYRFSRGTDPDGVIFALNRAANLIEELAMGEVAPDHIDLYPVKTKKKPITVRHKTLEDRLGYKVKPSEFVTVIKRLHCSIKTKGKNYLISAPEFRFDIEQEVDLVEEFARINGYDKIPESFPALNQSPSKHAEDFLHDEKLCQAFMAEGFLQAINYNFLNRDFQKTIFNQELWQKLGLEKQGDLVEIKNPLSDETACMRQSLLPGLITNLVYNHNHGLKHGRLFELGRVFGKNGEAFKESKRLACVIWGEPESLWKGKARPLGYDLKAHLENILIRLGVKGYYFKPYDIQMEQQILHPGQGVTLVHQGKPVGFLGTLHPKFRDTHKIRVDVAIMELDMEALMRGYPSVVRYKEISKMPAVERDVSFLVQIETSALDIMREIKRAAGESLIGVHVFDVYQGEGVKDGYKALAFRLKFQSLTETLSDDKVGHLFQGVLAGVKQKFNAEVR
jgi:phenylalanyl-tRNA synthetase beta chain